MTGDARHKLKIFISYHHDSAEFTRTLVDDIEDYRHDVWSDHELIPGDDWWRKILERIRSCDLFFFVANRQSIESEPCRQEIQYAFALKKPVVPVVDTAKLAINDLPAYLQNLEVIDIATGQPPYRKQLTRLLSNATRLPPPESPLPNEPGLPISPLAVIVDRLKDLTDLSEEEQVSLVHQLKRAPRKDAEQVMSLLETLQQRPETRNIVRQDIEQLLGKLAERLPVPDIGPNKSDAPETGLRSRAMKVLRVLPQMMMIAVVVAFVFYKVMEDSGPFAKLYSRDTFNVRSMLEQLDDPGFPDRELLTAHEQLEVTRERVIREHRLDEIQTRPIDQDFASWHLAIAEAAYDRGIPAVVELNLNIAEQLYADAPGIDELRRLVDAPDSDSSSSSNAALLASGQYDFRVVEFRVVENGDGVLFGKTDAYLTMVIGEEVVTPESFPSADGTSLRVGDDAVVAADYPFTLDVEPDTRDSIVHFRLYDRDSKNSDAPQDNQLIGHFDVRMSELTGMRPGEKMTLVSVDLAVGPNNATVVLARL